MKIDVYEKDISLTQEQIKAAENMFHYGMEIEEETGCLKIIPMNGNLIILHGEEEAKLFTSQIMGHYQEGKVEERAVECIMEILTQEGMTFKTANSIFQRVELILMESSRNFLDISNAKEVLGTPNGYR